jgi:hypothetical protein
MRCVVHRHDVNEPPALISVAASMPLIKASPDLGVTGDEASPRCLIT